MGVHLSSPCRVLLPRVLAVLKAQSKVSGIYTCTCAKAHSRGISTTIVTCQKIQADAFVYLLCNCGINRAAGLGVALHMCIGPLSICIGCNNL